MQALKIKIAGLGGRARARSLSPQRRSEIASWARRNRKQRENGEVSDADYLKILVSHIRASDPDFASFIKKICSMPLRFQERISKLLTPDELDLINQAHDAMGRRPT